jgi:hypothetical protein
MVPAGISHREEGKKPRNREGVELERSAGIVKQCYFHFVIACGMDFVGAWPRARETQRDSGMANNQMPNRQWNIKSLKG